MTKMQKMRSILLFAICAGVNFGARGMESKEEENQQEIDPVIWHYLTREKGSQGEYTVLLGKHLDDLDIAKENIFHITLKTSFFRAILRLVSWDCRYGGTMKKNRECLAEIGYKPGPYESDIKCFLTSDKVRLLQYDIDMDNLASYDWVVESEEVGENIFIEECRIPKDILVERLRESGKEFFGERESIYYN